MAAIFKNKFIPALLILILAIAMGGCESNQQVNSTPPEGMVIIKGGKNKDGSPIPTIFMDQSPVTVAKFDEFVRETGYTTEAQKFGNAGVFDTITHEWKLVDGANYLYPLGRENGKAQSNYPATQVSWNDVTAYCLWAHKRLPTKFEWEYASMNANAQYNKKYPWGDSLIVNGKYMANVWEGKFPVVNTVADGYAYTSPVGAFGKTPLGLTDIGGNVWQWCQDWKNENDTASAKSEKIQMGGSFLCDLKVCHGYKISSISSSTPETSLCHLGFRCVKDIDQ